AVWIALAAAVGVCWQTSWGVGVDPALLVARDGLSGRMKSKSITYPSRLSGPEKAAVVPLAISEEHASVWQALDEEEVKEVSQAMAGLGNVTSQVVEELLVEFVSGMSGGGAIM